MKIVILTYPLNNNFGNLLQAWALRHYLEGLGHTISVVDRQISKTQWSIIKNRIKVFIRRILRLKVYPSKSLKQERIYSQNTQKFIAEEIKAQHYFTTASLNREISNYEAVVVGSDQVWRPSFLPHSYKNYFLYELAPSQNIRRISYAASLGVDHWVFTPSQEYIAKKWLAYFDAISVREYSSIKLLKEHLSLDSVFMIDPTFLVEKSDYINLVEADKARCQTLNDKIFCYALDLMPSYRTYIDCFTKREGLSVAYIEDFYGESSGDQIYPSVTQWLYNLLHADYVITNSFHGCAFSIIFNKPFIVMFNEKRGNARLLSLLSLFNLESHIYKWEDLDSIRLEYFSVNWRSVNDKLVEYKNLAHQFVCRSLNN